jgi:NADH:ubiquinone oxidoreductase subunit 5 (subunit L)/multisubunit Na+/H+ antiporter MnhA subunit
MTTIILFAPLIGALICGFGWRLIGERAGQVITTGLVFLAAFLSWIIFLTFDGETQQVPFSTKDAQTIVRMPCAPIIGEVTIINALFVETFPKDVLDRLVVFSE